MFTLSIYVLVFPELQELPILRRSISSVGMGLARLVIVSLIPVEKRHIIDLFQEYRIGCHNRHIASEAAFGAGSQCDTPIVTALADPLFDLFWKREATLAVSPVLSILLRSDEDNGRGQACPLP